MTDRPRATLVPAVALAVFCVVLTYLALQVRAGNDPAIGAGPQASAAPARQVVVRRVVVERVDDDDPGSVAGSGATLAPAAPAPASPPVVSRGS
jgi:hypothetical protein